MTTKRLVVSLVATVAVMAILLFVVPLLLNAYSTVLNVVGASVVVGLVIMVIAGLHNRILKEKK